MARSSSRALAVALCAVALWAIPPALLGGPPCATAAAEPQVGAGGTGGGTAVAGALLGLYVLGLLLLPGLAMRMWGDRMLPEAALWGGRGHDNQVDTAAALARWAWWAEVGVPGGLVARAPCDVCGCNRMNVGLLTANERGGVQRMQKFWCKHHFKLEWTELDRSLDPLFFFWDNGELKEWAGSRYAPSNWGRRRPSIRR